jgi:hypothetical protein
MARHDIIREFSKARPPRPIPTDIGERLAYDPDTGIFTWKIPNRRSRPGDRADRADGEGYRTVCIRRVTYRAHRVAYFLVTGEQPPDFLDHKDLDKANNRWTNLRPADRAKNGINQRPIGTKYPKGVRPSGTTGRRFYARIKQGGVFRHLGNFGSVEEADLAYRRAAIELHGEFARFE